MQRSQDLLARHVLAELPDQLIQYYRARKIAPMALPQSSTSALTSPPPYKWYF